MKLRSDSFDDGSPIPPEYAFCKRDAPVALSGNRNPHLAWSDVPAGTRSLALICIDPDVPSKPDDVNQEGREIPANLPRVEFVHWLMADMPADCRELAAGSCSQGITPHGKSSPPGPTGAVQGRNDYTSWFEGDPDMSGLYLGYDGPCPPWNDSLLHHYHLRLVALDVPSLGLDQGFDLAALRSAMKGHVLAEAGWMGTYTLNPRLLED